MKRWAWLVVGLYFLVLLVLTWPVLLAAFAPKVQPGELAAVFVVWPYWAWLAVMVACQAALLMVPVGVAHRRPISRRSLLLPIGVAGLLIGALAMGAIFSLLEFAFKDQALGQSWKAWAVLATAVAVWLVWTLVFYRLSQDQAPADVVSRQCRYLLRGSILELLIAVPTHIVARYRDYCCAGFLTFIGLTFGIAVMVFSFGPAVFFLFVERWKRLHPTAPETPAPATGNSD